jgi:hypothetical protein
MPPLGEFSMSAAEDTLADRWRKAEDRVCAPHLMIHLGAPPALLESSAVVRDP